MHSEASIHRTLAIRLRPDLHAAQVGSADVATWVVKDPLTLEHFQCSTEEYAIMRWLRKPISIGEIQRRFRRAFPPQSIEPAAVWDFIGRIHDAGLVMTAAAGQGEELLDRMRRRRTRRWAMGWSSLLAMRFRGVDPDRFLSAMHAHMACLFSRWAFALVAMLIVFSLGLLAGHFDEFTARLPALSSLFDTRNLPWLVLSVALVKVFHELGHGLVCKHFGGEVRELGFMLLVFVPCLYCDVSDAWRLPSRWQRIAVSAAGIGVEIVLAALATIVWWFAMPGLVQLIALNVMVVCTVNTFVINGNPLLRYDGYYVLSDLTQSPNLWLRSREVLSRYAARYFVDNERSETTIDPLLPTQHRPWLALYAAASKAYLAVVFVAITWGLVKWLHPHRLEHLAYAIGFVSLGGVLIGPLAAAIQLARNPIRRAQVRKSRVAVVSAVGLAAAIALLSMPVNYYVKAPTVLMPADADRVAATIGGTLTNSLPSGVRVKRGETIAQLTNDRTQFEIERLEGERSIRQLRVQHLERLRGLDRDANDELPTARAALADSVRRLAELHREAARLTLAAPRDGVVIPVPRVPTAVPEDRLGSGARLASWSGSLTDEPNRGANVEPGTLVCLVGEPRELNAVMLVDDTDVKRLAPGQQVRLRFDQLPGQTVDGTVIEIARNDAPDTSDRAPGQRDLDALFTSAVPPGESNKRYQALIQFDPRPEALVIGGRGEAKVYAERISLGRLLFRHFARTFQLPL